MKKILLTLLITVSIAHGQWNSGGVPVLDTSAVTHELVPFSVSDGRGGIYIAWDDRRNGIDRNVYVQHLDASGTPTLERNGKLVCDAPFQQSRTGMAPDGMGGAYLTWTDNRSQVNSFIYAQRIDSTGALRWQTNGLLAAENGGLGCIAAPDGHSGVLLVWTQVFGLVAQRLDSTGQRMWGDSGVVVRNSNEGVYDWGIIGDGTGGAIVTWVQGPNNDARVYGQRISANGSVLWQPTGVQISPTGQNVRVVGSVRDNSGGVIIAWTLSAAAGVYAQRVNSQGVALWPSAVSLGCCGQGPQGIITDDQGGAIILASDRVQRVRPDGTTMWGGGITYTDSLLTSVLIPDGASGVIVAYQRRNNQAYAQRLDSTGTIRWMTGGVRLSSVVSYKDFVHGVPDERGGIIALWEDLRNWPPSPGIYAARVDSSGNLLVDVREDEMMELPASPGLMQNYPNPFNPTTTITYTLPERTPLRLGVYDLLGREVRTLFIGEANPGAHSIEWDGTDDGGRVLASGLYVCRLQTGDGIRVMKMLLLK